MILNQAIVGKTFGQLVVLRRLMKKASDGHYLVECRCTCGTVKRVALNNLGRTTFSCGCFSKNRLGIETTTHGHSKNFTLTPTYNSWRGMLNRCTQPTHNRFHVYGGRGIKVCKRWRKFENFLADMGERPPNTSINRINNDGDYKPSNCEWSTKNTRQKQRKAA